MKKTRALALVAICVAAGACGGTQPGGAVESDPKATEDDRPPVEDDRSLCVWRDRPDREVIETKGPGVRFKNIRRVFIARGQGQERRRVLVCREIDTNLDGVKDVVRNYNDTGAPISEEADSNYDGKIDTWVRFAGGEVLRVETDADGDGRPDETRMYVRGELSRVHRDENRDGRTDVWEVYEKGRLRRIGVDLNGDGHVDRWDRDELARRAAAEKDAEDAPDAPVSPTLGQTAEEVEAESEASKESESAGAKDDERQGGGDSAEESSAARPKGGGSEDPKTEATGQGNTGEPSGSGQPDSEAASE